MVCETPYDAETFHQHEGKPYCADHFKDLFAVQCSKCTKGIVGHIIEALGQNFHPECFVCEVGMHPIGEDTFFFMHEGKILCRPHYDELVLHPCSVCHQRIKGQYVKALGETFHTTCWHVRLKEMMAQSEIGRAVQQECRDRSRMPSSA
eukprot:TRINITY_DN42955_c0_g1_i4.p1 TRINITY_DN42955_c0_g1~~TRINITY_DN42955_c0_g1_i4.p1  ORF type:complete len:149 (-),score=13.69 TRINITY_DN42955_c0_g1_i4:24-470(-)